MSREKQQSRRRQILEFIFNGAAVQRFHTTPPLRPQTDGAHSFGVAWWCWLLTEGQCSRQLLLAALAHDLAEHVTGDVPAMVKRQNNIGVQLDALEAIQLGSVGLEFEITDAERRVLDLADALDGMMFCAAERKLGNRHAELWYSRWRTWIKDSAAGYEGWVTLVDELMTEAVL